MTFEMRALTEMRELTEAELDMVGGGKATATFTVTNPHTGVVTTHKVSPEGLEHGISVAAMHSHVIGL
jgi:hypothetical protein